MLCITNKISGCSELFWQRLTSLASCTFS